MMRLLDIGPRRLRQNGFSLIELMVAITLGLLLLAAIIKIFISSSYAFRLQQGSSRSQESGRAGVFILARAIRQTGFYTDPAQYLFASTIFPASAPAISGTEGGNNPDTLVIRYQGNADGTIVDCLGNSLAGGVIATNTFSLSAVNASTNARTLNCTRDIPGATPAVVADVQTLMEGIVDFQVEYGVDTNGDSIADQYVKANAITDWSTVRAVRIALTTNSLDQVGAGSATKQRITQTYNQTIQLRNL